MNFPDINFVETDTETITNELINQYESFTGRTLYPADPVRVFILWIASIIVRERALINDAARANVPRFARGKQLDSLCELFTGLKRLSASTAAVTMRFYISAPQISAVVINKGTRVTADGSVYFATEETAYINIGETFVDVPAKCETAGKIGNGFTKGQIKTLVDVFQFYDKCENITLSEGGADGETDEALYERMRYAMANASTAGAEQTYISYAKASSPLIADVNAYAPSPGNVIVCVLLKNGEIPGEEMLQTVYDTVNGKKVRPLTDHVSVVAPKIVSYDIDLTYYINSKDTATAAQIENNIKTAAEAFSLWQSEKLGRDINPSYLIQLIMQAGAKRVEITKPANTVVENNQVSKVKSVNLINGGIEEE